MADAPKDSVALEDMGWKDLLVGDRGLINMQAVKQTVLPVAGSVAGGLAGGPLGAAAGGGAGELANQYLGISEPNLLNVGLSMAPPLAGQALGMFGRSLPGANPGLQAYVVEQLGPRGGRLLSEVRPPIPSGALFQRVAATGQPVKVGTTSLSTALGETGAELAQVSEKLRPNVQGLVDGLTELTSQGQYIDFNKFRLNQSAMGEKMKTIIAQGGEGKGLAKKLYGAMWDDVDQAVANTPGPLGMLLRDAVASRKAEEGVSLLQKFVDSGLSRRVGNVEVNVDSIMTKIDRNRDLLRKLLPDGDVDGIMDTLKQFSNVGLSPKGAQAGLQGITYGQRAIVGGALAGAANILGFSGASQTLAGGAGATMAVEALSNLLASPAGRAIVKQIAKNGTSFNQLLNAIAQTGISAVGLRGQPAVVPAGSTPLVR